MSVLTDLARECKGEGRDWRQKNVIAGHCYISDGACAQFCAVWIKDYKWRVDFSTDLTVLDDAQWIANKSTVEDYLKAHGFVQLKLTKATAFWDKASTVGILGIVKGGPGFYVLTLSDVKGQAKVATAASKVHSVAFIHMKDNFQFFDPNFGMAKFKTSEALGEFFQKYAPRVLRGYAGAGYIEKYVG